MNQETIFTMKLDSDLQADFNAEAHAINRPPSELMRDLMWEFVQRQRAQREYKEFLARKVRQGEEDLRLGQQLSNEEVEAEFANLRKAAQKRP